MAPMATACVVPALGSPPKIILVLLPRPVHDTAGTSKINYHGDCHLVVPDYGLRLMPAYPYVLPGHLSRCDTSFPATSACGHYLMYERRPPYVGAKVN